MRKRMGTLLYVALLLFSGTSQAQTGRGAGERVDAAARAKMVERVSAALNETYVFPDVARKMEAAIRQKLKAGAYDTLNHPAELADVLTRDLQEVSKDKHLSVNYAPERPPGMGPTDSTEAAAHEQLRRQLASTNFGFEKVERLEGNVGYLDLRGFIGAELAGDTAVSAMNFLANSDAVIIDLRKNGGGQPSMIQLITSYFLEEPTHLNSFYIRKGNITRQFWTSAQVTGKWSIQKVEALATPVTLPPRRAEELRGTLRARHAALRARLALVPVASGWAEAPGHPDDRGHPHD